MPRHRSLSYRRRRRVTVCVLTLVCVAMVIAGSGAAGARSQAALPTRAALVEHLPRALSLARMRADLRALEQIADRNGGNARGRDSRLRRLRPRTSSPSCAARATTSASDRISLRGISSNASNGDSRSRRCSVSCRSRRSSTRRRHRRSGRRASVVESSDGCAAGDFTAVRGLIALVEARDVLLRREGSQRTGRPVLSPCWSSTTRPGRWTARSATHGRRRSPWPASRGASDQELASATNAIVELEIVAETRAGEVARTSQWTRAERRPRAARARRPSRLGARRGRASTTTPQGSSTLLEIARALRAQKRSSPLSVRFAFWGAEELGLFGSRAYARTVEPRPCRRLPQLRRPRLAVASIRRVREQTASHRAGLRFFERRGLRARTVDLQGRSDHASFAARGIPIGRTVRRWTTPATTKRATA